MSDLRPPATGTEAYLQAIHEVLCDIRAALVDGPAGDRLATEPAPGEPAPTKRTRTRPRG